MKGAEKANAGSVPIIDESRFSLGQFSHGTAHSFLGDAGATQYMRDWSLWNVRELSAKVKTHLLDERQGAEWEVIEQLDELSVEDPEMVGTRGQPASGNGAPVGESIADSPQSGEDVGRIKGASGWTKLKSRNGETGKGSR